MKSRTIPGKSRILGVCCLLFFGLFVLYHVQQVDDLRLAVSRCDQHELTMRSKLDGEMEKVERLEKRLEVNRVSEEKLQQKFRDLRDKALKDSNMRFASLQQHYKLLQSEHEDVKVEYANLQRSQAISKKANAAAIVEWKSKYSTLEGRFQHLERAMNNKTEGKSPDLDLKNQQLRDELIEMRKRCDFRVDVVNGGQFSVGVPSLAQGRSTDGQEVQRSFDEQVRVGVNTYKIPIRIQSGGAASLNSNNNKSLQNSSSNRTMDLQRDAVWPIASLSSTTTTRRSPGGIINSVENFQILPKPLRDNNNNENVLKEPNFADANKLKSSTATSDKRRESLDRALPIAIAQLQSSTTAALNPGIAPVSPGKHRKVPEGVVPIPESMNALLNREEPKDILNARYGNVAAPDPPKLTADEEHNQVANFQLNGNEVENGAHEVNDFNIIEDRNHHDHLQDVLDDEKIVINNNAAEEERGGVDEGGENTDKRNEIDLAIINRDLHGGDKKEGQLPKKGNDEFVADQGFDEHMEEHVEEEDDDEYPNLAAQQEEGHAVRN